MLTLEFVNIAKDHWTVITGFYLIVPGGEANEVPPSNSCRRSIRSGPCLGYKDGLTLAIFGFPQLQLDETDINGFQPHLMDASIP